MPTTYTVYRLSAINPRGFVQYDLFWANPTNLLDAMKRREGPGQFTDCLVDTLKIPAGHPLLEAYEDGLLYFHGQPPAGITHPATLPRGSPR